MSRPLLRRRKPVRRRTRRRIRRRTRRLNRPRARRDAGTARTMTETPPMMPTLDRPAWKLSVIVLLRTTLSVSALFAAYFLIPTRSADDGSDLPWLILELGVFAVIVAIQVPAIVKAKYPILRAIETLAVVIPLYLLIFARIYLSSSLSDPSVLQPTPQRRHRPLLHGHGLRERRLRRHRRPDRQPATSGDAPDGAQPGRVRGGHQVARVGCQTRRRPARGAVNRRRR